MAVVVVVDHARLCVVAEMGYQLVLAYVDHHGKLYHLLEGQHTDIQDNLLGLEGCRPWLAGKPLKNSARSRMKGPRP